MLKVKTKLDCSKVHGIGLFADQFIPKGTVTWRYDSDFDMKWTDKDLEEVEKTSPWIRDQFMKYSYFDHKKNHFILCVDDQRFINHSDKPNILSTPDFDVANRDIEQGEELLCDYRDYESDWFERRSVNRQDFVTPKVTKTKNK